MKLSLILLVAPLVALLSCSSSVDAAAAVCEGTCEIALEKACTEVQATLEFKGDCCTLKETDGECFMVTTGSCQYKGQGESELDCTEDEDGNLACVPGYTVYTAQTDDECPTSEFDVPEWVDDESGEAAAPAEDDGEAAAPAEDGEAASSPEQELIDLTSAAVLGNVWQFSVGAALVLLAWIV